MTHGPDTVSRSMTVLVPVRNEEDSIENCLRSTLAAVDRLDCPVSIIVVDDSSSDETVLRAKRVEDSRIGIVEASELCTGGGKSRALAAGFATVPNLRNDDLLLFLDADVTLGAGSLAAVLPLTKRYHFVSLSPSQHTIGVLSGSFQPILFDLLDALFPYARVNDPDDSLAAANGQFILLTVGAYRSLGTHAAVDGEILEDIALASAAKRSGLRVFFGPGEPFAVTCLMYRSFSALFDGWSKNLYQLGATSWLVTATHLSLLVAATAAFGAALIGAALLHGGTAALGVLVATSAALTLRRRALFTPLHVVAGTAVCWPFWRGARIGTAFVEKYVGKADGSRRQLQTRTRRSNSRGTT